MKYQGTNAEGLPTVADVGRVLGPEVVALVETPLGESQYVSGITINDFYSPPKPSLGAIALLIGAAPANIEWNNFFDQLTNAGYVAVVYKTYGGSDVALRAAARIAGCAAFRAAGGIPWDQLTDFFRAAIVPHSGLSHSLVDIRPGDLFELANAVASMAGGAVAIADPGQTVLAYSTLPEQPIDETRRASILRLHVPPTKRNNEDYQRVHAARDVVCVAAEENSLSRSAVAIRAGEVVLGSLWLIDAAIADAQDTERVLLEASNVAALHLLHRRTNHDVARDRTAELVKPLLFEPDRAELAAIQLGLMTPELRVVAISAVVADLNAPEALRSSMLLFDTVRTACAVRLPGAICGFSDNIVYIVMPHGPTLSPQFHRTTLLRIVRHACRVLGRPVLAGMGNKQAVTRAIQSRTEAESVLAMLLQDIEDDRLSADSDGIVGDPQLLGARLHLRNVVTTLRESGHLPGDLATRIAAHDMQRKTAYEETIRTFLDCNSNAIETAAMLGLHSNTVRYRLSRVEPLFGVNLDSPETRLVLWLQLSANQM